MGQKHANNQCPMRPLFEPAVFPSSKGRYGLHRQRKTVGMRAAITQPLPQLPGAKCLQTFCSQ